MSRVLLLLAEGFEEIEAVTIVDVLRRAEVEVVTAGLTGRDPVPGSCGVRIVPDVALAHIEGEWDLVVLPGGSEGTDRLAKSPEVLELLQQRAERGLPIAAICAAPLVLDKAGVLSEGKFTCYPGVESEMATMGRRHERLVDEDGVITSQGPATAMDFALHLVQRLRGTAVSSDVARGLLHGY
jgi:DJ-1 family protein